MDCKRVFPRSFCIATLGKVYYNSVYKPYILDANVQLQKQLLKSSQPFADYELKRREMIEKRRFRQYIEMPPIPELQDISTSSFPCPNNNCRGFVFGTKCGICKKEVCVLCREMKKDPSHECDPDIAKSIAQLISDSRPCPRCQTLIHRIEGCDHMHCTFCGVHFHYVTLRILSMSTNEHYRNTQIIGITRPINTGNENDMCEFDLDDGIPQTVFQTVVSDKRLEKLLYDDRNCIKFIKNSKFDERHILNTCAKKLNDVRVKFLLGEITDSRFTSTIRSCYETRDKNIDISVLFLIFLNGLKSLQFRLYRKEVTETAALDECKELFTVMNTEFQNIYKEYGQKSKIQIRQEIFNFEEPVIKM